MSEIYDNWERLVAKVLRREELWQLFHEQSRSPSICSESSDFRSGSCLDDDDLRSADSEVKVEGSTDLIAAKEIEQYAPGEYVRNAAITVVNVDKHQENTFTQTISRFQRMKLVLKLHVADDKMLKDAKFSKKAIKIAKVLPGKGAS